MPTRNVPLLRGTLAHVEANPQQHEQAAWGFKRMVEGETCGTTHCYAGWALVLGAPDSSIDWRPLYDWDEGPTEFGATHVYLSADSCERTAISVAARELLGLTVPEADRLFHGDNTLNDLRLIVGELCDGVPA